MYTRKTYRLKDMAWWTRFDTFRFFVYIMIWVALYHFLDLHWLKIPWAPLALIGTAVAFIIGFQNNAAYGRIWEARKIWGGVVNTSRTFGMFVQDMVTNEHTDTKLSSEELHHEIKTLTYRHVAWMTATRYAMRQQKPWEVAVDQKTNREWNLMPPEKKTALEEALRPYLSEKELAKVMSRNNKQTAILYQQSHHLRRLKEEGAIWEFAFLQLESVLEELFTLQGKSERIKNFPYPRQYATLNHYFMWLLILLLPMALVPQFIEIAAGFEVNNDLIKQLFVWFSVPVYVMIAWVFHTMERIGKTGENPFEGTSNDVPISTIARGIEIDLRQNLGEQTDEIPEQFPMEYDIQW